MFRADKLPRAHTICSGIGKECAISFAKEGAAGVVVADIKLEAAEQVAEIYKKAVPQATSFTSCILADCLLPA